MDEVRERAILGICVHAIRNAERVDGTKVGIIQTLSPSSTPEFLAHIASALKRQLLTSSYLFAISPPHALPGAPAPLMVCSSSKQFVDYATVLIGSKFVGRVEGARLVRAERDHTRWVGLIRDFGTSSYDEEALWDVVRKAARAPVDPLIPPPGSVGVEQLLRRARARLERVSPQAAYHELLDRSSQWPVVLVDIRPESQRRQEGTINGATIVERNALEWLFDPRSPQRLPVADRYDVRIILMCDDGTASSLAAASLLDLGLLNATDMIGGYAAWRAAGLPAEVEVLASGIPIDVLQAFSPSMH